MNKQSSFSNTQRSKSSSLLIKQKIHHALGKKSVHTSKKQIQKNDSSSNILIKTRSKSEKSLIMKNNNVNSYTNRLFYEQSSKKKYSYHQQFHTPIKKTIIYEDSKNSSIIQIKQKPQIKSVINNNQSDRNNFNFNHRFIWFDYYDRQLIITQKKSSVIGGKKQIKFSIQLSIKLKQNQNQLLLVKENDKIFVSKIDQIKFICYRKTIKEKQPNLINQAELKKGININFNGYLIFGNCSNQNNSLILYFLDEIQKLQQDGVKQYEVISKILKRKMKQKISISQLHQNKIYFLLIQCKGTSLKQLVNIKKSSATQQLIAQKLLSSNKFQNQKIAKSNLIFQNKKFLI